MVEFGLVFPVQLLLTLAIIQFAYLAHAHMVVSQAAFQAARAGAVADVGVAPADRREAIRLAGSLGALLAGSDGSARTKLETFAAELHRLGVLAVPDPESRSATRAERALTGEPA